MISKKIILVFMFSMLVPGCSFLRPSASNQDIQLPVGKIIQGEKVKEGGRLFVVPFSAGRKVAATDELDRISFKIIQGVSVAVVREEAPFILLGQSDADTADFILKGRIVEKKKSWGFKKWVLRQKKHSLAVKGEMIDREAGQVILTFSHNRSSKDAEQNFESLGVQIGEDIVQFVLSGR